MNDNQYLKKLLDNYLHNNLSNDEKQLFYDLVRSGEYDDIIAEDIKVKFNSSMSSEKFDVNKDVAEKIIRDTFAYNIHKKERKSNSLLKKLITYTSIAALLALVGFIFLNREDSINLITKEDPKHYKGELITYSNNTNEISKIKLADGSLINVYPESSLSYPKNFTDSNRVVYLDGTAFFEITKDSSKPFIVYSKKLSTRVLGTSFLINSNNGVEEVEVRTGKVEIKSNVSNNDKNKSLILTPNQKCIYNNKTKLLSKTLVDHPKPILPDIISQKEIKSNLKFIYDQVLIPEIISDLEDEYGVKIVLKNDKLKTNVFTGELVDIDLFKKLEIICLSTQSSYEVDGVNIVIK